MSVRPAHLFIINHNTYPCQSGGESCRRVEEQLGTQAVYAGASVIRDKSIAQSYDGDDAQTA
jgi:hypothetical protein